MSTVLRGHEARKWRPTWRPPPVETGRTKEGTEKRHQDSHVLNAEGNRDKECMQCPDPGWDRQTEASMWKWKPRSQGSDGWVDILHLRTEGHATGPHHPRTRCQWPLPTHSPGPVTSGLPFSGISSSSPPSGQEVGFGGSARRENSTAVNQDVEGHPAAGSPGDSILYLAHIWGPDAALSDSEMPALQGSLSSGREGLTQSQSRVVRAMKARATDKGLGTAQGMSRACQLDGSILNHF